MSAAKRKYTEVSKRDVTMALAQHHSVSSTNKWYHSVFVIQSYEHMAHPTALQRFCHSCWQPWWRRSRNSCCSKRILLLLVWQGLISFSLGLLQMYGFVLLRVNIHFLRISQVVSFLLAPFVGWLADFKIGRYEIIRFGSIISFSASIFCYFALFTGGVSCSVLFMATYDSC